MKSFPHPNLGHGWSCPVCHTSADRSVVLVGMPWTEHDGIVEAKQVHERCWELILEMREDVERGEKKECCIPNPETP